ncbi:MAG TPA: hypothetical protein VNR18_14605, partial [Hyphomicrobiales bacterium]|nr:hypothetical protein [Hyphomicrobiales bacterium]
MNSGHATLPPEADAQPGLAQERFGFTVFLSVCVHVVLILGVGFSYTAQPRASTSLEVTLASYRSAEAPDEADFLAQANQQGSGTLDEARAPASPTQSPFSTESDTELADFLVERPTQPGVRDVVAVTGAGANAGAMATEQPLDLQTLNAQRANTSIA